MQSLLVTLKLRTMNLQQIRFVLVEPSHPGNIGAVARAIKTMGFVKLVLVKPRLFPHDDALARAAGASDVLESAQVVDSLDAAIADCQLVIGTSVRDRRVSWPIKSPKEMSSELNDYFTDNVGCEVAIVFGRERTGLENSELDKTHWQIRIPANDDYSSLNLASAAQIIAYELRCALYDSKSIIDGENTLTGAQARQRVATQAELSGYFVHLEETLHQLEFVRGNSATKLMRKIIRLYNRAQINLEELQILRGILTAIQGKLMPTKADNQKNKLD